MSMSSVPWLSKNFKPKKGHLTASVDGSHLTASCDCKIKPAHRQAHHSDKEGRQSMAALLFCPRPRRSPAVEMRPLSA
jgi:hypothetical protein